MAGERTVTLTAGGRSSGSLWAITAYFNPLGYRRRLENYRTFRSRLDIPLVAVELGCDTDFELGDGDADVLIQLRGRDVMWQKERLLNVGLRALPDECGKVVWMDCDLVVESPDWPGRLTALLDRHPLVQAFSQLKYLSADWTHRGMEASVMWTQPAVLALMADAGTGSLASHVPIGPDSSCKGGAWAARREAVEECGLYDACIIGGGDLALTAALEGRFDVATRTMNQRQADHYLAWARGWHDTFSGLAGFLEGSMLHLWHGDAADRRYRERHEGLRQFGFDPFTDIVVDDDGAWRWNSDKSAMHEYVGDYFASRREDGAAQVSRRVRDEKCHVRRGFSG